MDNKKLADIFNKFAGQEIKDPRRLTCDTDETLEALQRAAKDNGLALRLRFPSDDPNGEKFHSHTAMLNRVNIQVAKAADGKYRVTGQFNLG